MRALERAVMLRVIDSHWVEHLTSLQNLRQGIGLHAFGQRDPLVMYKKESHELFEDLLMRIRDDIVHTIFHIMPIQNKAETRATTAKMVASRPSVMAGVINDRPTNVEPLGKKVGRNDPCPCGSSKKYKRCHGASG